MPQLTGINVLVAVLRYRFCGTSVCRHKVGRTPQSLYSMLLYRFSGASACRYKLGRTPLATDPPGSIQRSTLTRRLAQKLSERASKLQQSGALPPSDTCDLIILDRCVHVCSRPGRCCCWCDFIIIIFDW